MVKVNKNSLKLIEYTTTIARNVAILLTFVNNLIWFLLLLFSSENINKAWNYILISSLLFK